MIRARWGIRVRDARNPRTALIHQRYLTWWGANRYAKRMNRLERKGHLEFTYAPERLR